MPAQTLRRKVDTETYESIASGQRGFTAVSETEDVMIDDVFVFVEMVDDKPKREVYRRVAELVHYEDADLYIAGFVPVEYQALEGVFADGGVVVAYAFAKEGDNLGIIDGPILLPLLTVPYVDPNQLNEFLSTNLWPDGQYSVMLRANFSPIESGHQDITVQETSVMVRVMDDSEDGPIDKFVTVDSRFLIAGQLHDLFGNKLQPHFAEVTYGSPETDQTPMDRIVEAADDE